jgi:hypothetical protein
MASMPKPDAEAPPEDEDDDEYGEDKLPSDAGAGAASEAKDEL